MEDPTNYSEKIQLNAILLDGSEIKNCKIMSKYPRIPSVIEIDKKYETFEIVTKIENARRKKLVLIKDMMDCDTPDMFKISILLKYSYFTYHEILSKLLPTTPPHSFQTIGPILHVNLDPNHLPHKKIIGQVLLDKTKNIKSVITKIGQIDNTFRFFQVEVIAGEQNLEVIHIEMGIKYFIDYGKVYWNSKLQSERENLFKILFGCKRISDTNNYTICDPFCGVGPNVLYPAKHGSKIYCNDLNPVAIQCIKAGISLNKIDEKLFNISNTDAKIFLASLLGTKITHFIFNLPEHSLEYLSCLEGFNEDAVVFAYFFNKLGQDPHALLLEHVIGIRDYQIQSVRSVSPTKKTMKLVCRVGDIVFRH